jgi:hypothetical protein
MRLISALVGEKLRRCSQVRNDNVLAGLESVSALTFLWLPINFVILCSK